MNAIFDKKCILVAWLYEDKYIFDKDMRWIGFIQDEYIFNNRCRWLGGFYKHTVVDKAGKAIAWEEGYSPRSRLSLITPLIPLIPLTPLNPLTPLTPLTPLIPLVPQGGWSALSWDNFLNQ